MSPTEEACSSARYDAALAVYRHSDAKPGNLAIHKENGHDEQRQYLAGE